VANQAIAFMNPGRKPNITGFRMSADGRLTPIPGSTIEFPAGQGLAQVEFSPSGSVLAVTAGFQTDGRIHTFAVMPDGTLKEGPGSPSDRLQFPGQRDHGLRRGRGHRGDRAERTGVPERRHVAVFAIGADRLPRELPAGRSPYMVTSRQWTAGLVVK
jgi:hypothetical protein